jgi:hypothetical protein
MAGLFNYIKIIVAVINLFNAALKELLSFLVCSVVPEMPLKLHFISDSLERT